MHDQAGSVNGRARKNSPVADSSYRRDELEGGGLVDVPVFRDVRTRLMSI